MHHHHHTTQQKKKKQSFLREVEKKMKALCGPHSLIPPLPHFPPSYNSTPPSNLTCFQVATILLFFLEGLEPKVVMMMKREGVEDRNGYSEEDNKKKKGGASGSNSSMRCCQAEKCNADLHDAKQYHKRHKVCEYHAKAQVVIVAGTRQRFCQQCSRFHELGEFDETKRSCRRRLAGHNERRRKNSVDQSQADQGSSSSSRKGSASGDDRGGRIQITVQENAAAAAYKHFQIT